MKNTIETRLHNPQTQNTNKYKANLSIRDIRLSKTHNYSINLSKISKTWKEIDAETNVSAKIVSGVETKKLLSVRPKAPCCLPRVTPPSAVIGRVKWRGPPRKATLKGGLLKKLLGSFPDFLRLGRIPGILYCGAFWLNLEH